MILMIFGPWIILVGGVEHLDYVSIYWECHHPNWRTPSFFRWVGQPPTSIFYDHLWMMIPYAWKLWFSRIFLSIWKCKKEFPIVFDLNLSRFETYLNDNINIYQPTTIWMYDQRYSRYIANSICVFRWLGLCLPLVTPWFALRRSCRNPGTR
jgi:hypothetical protein